MTDTRVTVKPMTVHIGAEVGGVDLSRPLTEEQISVIRKALNTWKVIFFRNQPLSHEQHIAFGRQFGELTSGHIVFGNDAEYPEIYPVTKHRTASANRPAAARVWTDWHTDVTAAINPPFGSILRAVIVPPYGGDTQWTNMVAAYRALSPKMQAFLATLRAVHQFKRAGGGENAESYNRKVDEKSLMTEHPIVTVHPETGEHALFANQQFVKEIAGLTMTESDMLLEYLWEHCIRAEFTVRFRWEEGSIAFWDNRSTQHLAVRDVFDTDFDREFYRVTLNGSVPVGIDGKPSNRISGDAIESV